MRWGNRLPRDMLDKGDEDGNLKDPSQKDAQSGEIGNLAQVYTGYDNKLNTAPLQSTKLPHQPPFVFFWETGTWPTPFLNIDPLFNIDFGERRLIWNELFWSEFV